MIPKVYVLQLAGEIMLTPGITDPEWRNTYKSFSGFKGVHLCLLAIDSGLASERQFLTLFEIIKDVNALRRKANIPLIDAPKTAEALRDAIVQGRKARNT